MFWLFLAILARILREPEEFVRYIKAHPERARAAKEAADAIVKEYDDAT